MLLSPGQHILVLGIEDYSLGSSGILIIEGRYRIVDSVNFVTPSGANSCNAGLSKPLGYHPASHR